MLESERKRLDDTIDRLHGPGAAAALDAAIADGSIFGDNRTEIQQVTVWTMYEWECPDCSEINSEGMDQPDEVVQCEVCGTYFAVGDIR